MVSWIPGLELEMRTPYWAALNEFFVARRVSCLWAEPAASQDGAAVSERNHLRPWIDLRKFFSNRHHPRIRLGKNAAFSRGSLELAQTVSYSSGF